MTLESETPGARQDEQALTHEPFPSRSSGFLCPDIGVQGYVGDNPPIATGSGFGLGLPMGYE
ncbi:MAG: hypothetical protein M3P18_05540 [Actinomycetota bacterium]|nr:hypothetical protein [Actinomycetota bacterium]